MTNLRSCRRDDGPCLASRSDVEHIPHDKFPGVGSDDHHLDRFPWIVGWRFDADVFERS